MSSTSSNNFSSFIRKLSFSSLTTSTEPSPVEDQSTGEKFAAEYSTNNRSRELNSSPVTTPLSSRAAFSTSVQTATASTPQFFHSSNSPLPTSAFTRPYSPPSKLKNQRSFLASTLLDPFYSMPPSVALAENDDSRTPISFKSHNNSLKMSTLSTTGLNKMEDLIPIVNRLQDVFLTIGQETLDLPQIVVVGSQSSGKSSVLENIVQKDFLPRGKEIVTRRPLILQLVHVPPKTDAEGRPSDSADYAEFLHLTDRRFTDFEQVRTEIEKETERIAGQNKGISRVPIQLKIYSSRVLNLTLVDLPGITKIPVGDQPMDIEMRIRSLVLEYIAKPNAIILAVSPANQDIVNSEALKIAREVDPEGKRTLGVLTKLDLMDAGTNAHDILSGRTYPLKLGFIGTVNRSQQDINERKNIQEALKREEAFFRDNPAYRSISSRCGTAYLARTLNALLMHHIREKLPELKTKLNLLIVQTEQELNSYGDPIFSGKQHQGSLLLRLLTKFSNNFNSSIDGTYAEISTTELCGGARLYYIFNSIFGQNLESIDPCTGLSVQDIRTAIRNSTGPRPSLFIPEIAFDLLIKPQIKKLELPCLRCVELVFDEMLKIVNACETKELARFPKLHQKVVEVVVDLLRERMSPTQAYIESLVAIQLAYINTNHPDFIGGSAAIAMLQRKHEKRRREAEKKSRSQANQLRPTSDAESVVTATSHRKEKETELVGRKRDDVVSADLSRSFAKQTQLNDHLPHGRDGGFLTYFFGGQLSQNTPEPLSSRSRSNSPTSRQLMSESDPHLLPHEEHRQVEHEEIEVELIRSLIRSYFQITRKTIGDLVPKTVMHLIVNYARENIQNRLVSSLYREDLFGELLCEDEAIMNERAKCKLLLDTYRKGASVLQDIY